MADEPATAPDAAAGEHDEHAGGEHDEHGKPKPGEKPGGKDAGEQSYLKKHRDMIIVVLTMVGVIIGYLSLKAKPAASTADSSTQTDPTGQGIDYAAGATPGQSYAGDGGASDGFSAYLGNLTDTLGQIESSLATQTANQGTGTATPSPFDTTNMNQSWAAEPASTPARFLFGKAAAGLKYIRNATTGAIYQVNPNGKGYHLTPAQWAALGKPKYTNYDVPKPKPPAKKK